MEYHYIVNIYGLPEELVRREEDIRSAVLDCIALCDQAFDMPKSAREPHVSCDLAPRHRLGPTACLYVDYKSGYQPSSFPVEKPSLAARHFEMLLKRVSDRLYQLSQDGFRVTGELDGAIVHWRYDQGVGALVRQSQDPASAQPNYDFSVWANPSYEDAHL